MDLPEVFISYSRDNKDWMLRFKKHLEALETSGILKPWVDEEIDPGSRWDPTIKEAVDRCAATILLVSDSFLTTDYIRNTELPRLMERNERKEILLLWVPIRSSAVDHDPTFMSLESYKKGPTVLEDLSKSEQRAEIKVIGDTLVGWLGTSTGGGTDVAELSERLRVLCLFARPVQTAHLHVHPFPPVIDLRTEYRVFAGAFISRANAPVAFHHLNCPTSKRLAEYLSERAARRLLPHVIHFSGLRCSTGLVLPNELGKAKCCSFSELRQVIANGYRSALTPPLLVCDILGNFDCSAPEFNQLAQPPLKTVVTRIKYRNSEADAGDWADFYVELARAKEVTEAIEHTLPDQPLTIEGTGDAVIQQALTGRPPFFRESVSTADVPAGTPYFCGRGKELIEIAKGLKTKQVTLITGLRRIGKSSLAIEAVYRNLFRFPGGFASFSGLEGETDAGSLTATGIINSLTTSLMDSDATDLCPNGTVTNPITQWQSIVRKQPCLFLLRELGEFASARPNELRKLLRLLVDYLEQSHCIITMCTEPEDISDFSGHIHRLTLSKLQSNEALQLTQWVARRSQPPITELIDNEKAAQDIATYSAGYPWAVELAVRMAQSEPVSVVIEQLKRFGESFNQFSELVGWHVDRLDDDSRRVFHFLELFPARSISDHSWNAFKRLFRWEVILKARAALTSAHLIEFDRKRWYWDRAVHEYATKKLVGAEDRYQLYRAVIELYAGLPTHEDERSEALFQAESAVNVLAIISSFADVVSDAKESQAVLQAAREITAYARRNGLTYRGKPLLGPVFDTCKKLLEADGRVSAAPDIAALLHDIASIEQQQGDFDSAKQHYELSYSINKQDNSLSGLARSHHGLGRLAQDLGNFDEAKRRYDESFALRQKLRCQEEMNDNDLARIIHELGRLAHDRGEIELARRQYEEAIRLYQGDQKPDVHGIAWSVYEHGRLGLETGQWKEAKEFYRRSEELFKEADSDMGLAVIRHAQAFLEALKGHTENAYDSLEESLEGQRDAGDGRGVGATYTHLGILELQLGHIDNARRHLEAGHEEEHHASHKRGEINADIGLSLVLHHRHQSSEAEVKLKRLLQDAEEGRKEPKLVARIRIALGKVQQESGKAKEAFENLFKGLEISLWLGDRCSEAVVKSRLGILLGSKTDAGNMLLRDAENLGRELFGSDWAGLDALDRETLLFC